jgi:hypothetical protein
MRNTVNIMTTLRSDEGRTEFRFVVDQSYFPFPHCLESPGSHAPRRRLSKVYWAHSERVVGSFRKGTGLIPKGKCKGGMQLIIYHSSEKRSGMRGVSTRLSHVFLTFSFIK